MLSLNKDSFLLLFPFGSLLFLFFAHTKYSLLKGALSYSHWCSSRPYEQPGGKRVQRLVWGRDRLPHPSPRPGSKAQFGESCPGTQGGALSVNILNKEPQDSPLNHHGVVKWTQLSISRIWVWIQFSLLTNYVTSRRRLFLKPQFPKQKTQHCGIIWARATTVLPVRTFSQCRCLINVSACLRGIHVCVCVCVCVCG